ncbi:PTS transporter subunit EIIB [Aerococcus urinaeequi]|uniref:PTS transporter subunit EIIB n=1 Tax=Aerococcus urinaeequi TaxID=51665 RepID=UPI003D6BB84D
MNDKQLAEHILELLGGDSNVNQATHCVTRLRVTINNSGKVRKADLSNIEDVIGVNQVGNQTQVILGGRVHGVYDEFQNLLGDKDADQVVQEEKKGFTSQFLDALSSIFNPILSALIGAGLLKRLPIFLMFYELVSVESDLYQFLNILALQYILLINPI